VLGIWIRKFLGLLDPDALVRGMDPDLSLSHKSVEWTEIMFAKYNFNTKFLAKN
jgi:hypothetical protein